MAGIKVFRCPSCGASVSTDGEEAQITCQFCGTTVIVPEELRTKRPPPLRQPPIYQPQIVIGGPTSAPAPPTVGRARSRSVGRILGLVLTAVIACYALSALLPLVAGLGAVIAGVLPVATTFVNLPPLEGLSTAVPPSPTPGFAELTLSFGGEGTGAGKFDDPRAIAVDGQGNVYVGEYSSARVQKFDSTGQFLSSWTAEYAGTTNPLRNMAADRAGNVYVVRGGNILKYAGADGQLQAVFESDHGYDDVVVLPNGGLLACACFGSDDLVFLDADGTETSRVPQAVTSLTGDAVSNLHLAVDGLGNIFVLSQKHNAVFEYDSSGRFTDRFGSEGDAPGQFTSTGAIAVDNRSRVYISDFPGIQVFTPDGQFVDVFDVPKGFVLGLAFSDRGELYAASNSNFIYKFGLTEQ
jgi:streptogramin lyase/DNA-directed RNA polymerase subunit RPC12/RpoP